MKIKARKLSKSSLFKLILVSQVFPMGLFMLFCGIAALSGSDTIKFNGSPVTGIPGLLSAVVMYPLFLLFFSAFIWIGSALGLWTFSWFRKIELDFIDGVVVEESMPQQFDDLTVSS